MGVLARRAGAQLAAASFFFGALAPFFAAPVLRACGLRREGSSVFGSKKRTLLAWIGHSICTRSPFGLFWLGFLCFQRRLTPSTTTRFSSRRTDWIVPFLPLSLPEMTTT